MMSAFTKITLNFFKNGNGAITCKTFVLLFGAFFWIFIMAVVAHDIQTVNSTTTYKYIVIGTGPVGVRFIQEISKLQPDASIAIFW